MFRVCAIGIVTTTILLCAFMGNGWAQSSADRVLTPPSFTGSLRESSSSGHIKIIWDASDEVRSGIDFQLQKSQDPTFAKATTLYQGDDLATFLSGLENGEYYFRLRYVDEVSSDPVSDWSEALWLTVKHHSLQLALWLFVLGAIVFFLTVFVLIKGVRDSKEAKC